MQNNSIASTTINAIRAIAAEQKLDPDLVELVIDQYIAKIRAAVRAEIPFAVRGLGKFYLRYSNKNLANMNVKNTKYYEDKVMREIKFVPSDEWKAEMNGWVHDFGIKSNKSSELMRLRIKPDELDKMRKKKILDEQRSLGFRSDLLFDDAPASDKAFEATLGKPPTVSEIMRRIGINLDE